LTRATNAFIPYFKIRGINKGINLPTVGYIKMKPNEIRNIIGTTNAFQLH